MDQIKWTQKWNKIEKELAAESNNFQITIMAILCVAMIAAKHFNFQ